MRFWQDVPVDQWIYVMEEPHNQHPWCVMIGGSVRARFTYKSEANELIDRLKKEFLIGGFRPIYKNVYCSSCGECFGPGACGFSHCSDHQHLYPTGE